MNKDYTWVKVFNDIAYKLLEFKNDRTRLVNIMYEILEEIGLYSEDDESNCNLDKYNGVRCKYDDFDPFSFMNRLALYNFENRKKIIRKFQEKTGMDINVPTGFDGIPSVNPQLSCLLTFKDERKPNDINEIWEFFEIALNYPSNQTLEMKEEFIKYYDILLNKPNCKYNISMCLFRMNPNFYINLDSTNRSYLKEKLNINITKCPSGREYLELMDNIKKLIDESDEFESLFHFSETAWIAKRKPPVLDEKTQCWLMSPGENAVLWEDFVEKEIIAIGWDKLGNLSDYNNAEQIYESLQNNYSKENPVHDKCACYDFVKNMKIGDIVIAKKGRKTLLGYGYIESDYYFDETREQYKHVRKVKWKKVGEWKNTIIDNALKTLTEISKYDGYSEDLLSIMNGDVDMTKYYWLNANPKIWSFSELKVGETIEYTAVNENGNKRKVYQNYLDAKAGDKIIAYESTPVKKIVGLCEVKEKFENGNLLIKKIEQLINPIEYKDIVSCAELENMEFIKVGQGSLFKLEKEEYDFIYDLIRETNVQPINQKLSSYDENNFLKDVYIEKEKYNEIKGLLENKLNIILQGAPGVGKTYMAKRLAYSLMGEENNNRIEFIQFHQSYSYEDFIEGYRPISEGGFELTRGIFYNFCKKAENDPSNSYYMIIDEINRGNLSKIFGELLMLIEKDKRDKESLTLAYSKQKFSVPKNLYIIGMMNTADRSLAILDYALRRRFSFVDVTPAFENKTFKNFQKTLNNGYLNKVIDRIKLLNNEIIEDPSLGKGFVIGHSYFCELKNNCSNADVKLIIKYEILPMLKEYWFDDDNKVEEWNKRLLEE